MSQRYGDFVPMEFRPWCAVWSPPLPFLFLGELFGNQDACVNCGCRVVIPDGADGEKDRLLVTVFTQGIQCSNCTLFLEQVAKNRELAARLRSRHLS